MTKITTRIISFILAIIILSVPVFAVTDNYVQPRYTYISLNQAEISINKSTGVALCTATVGTGQYCTVTVSGTLQKFSGGRWIDIKSWSATNTTAVAITNSYAIESGYVYRFITNCYVYNSNGTLVESANASHYADYYK